MLENDIHKLLLSFGMLPMITILRELEDKEDYDKCISLRDAINSYRAKYYFAFSADKKIETEEDYEDYWNQFGKEYGRIAKGNMSYYIKEIKEKLEL